MIEPLKAIAGRTTMTKPSCADPKKAYSNTMNNAVLGQKLNINCNNERVVSNRKIDYYA